MTKYYSILVLFFCIGLSFSQIKESAIKKRITAKDSLEITIKNNTKFPVVPFKDTLFFIQNKIGSFTAQKRAEAISERIIQLFEDPFFDSDSLCISQADISLDIVYKRDFVIMSITDLDAEVNGKKSIDLATLNRSIINKAILFEKENNSILNWLKRIGLELFFVFLIFLILYFINQSFNRLKSYLLKREPFFKESNLKLVHLFSPEKQLHIILSILGLVRVCVLVFVVYLALPLLFSVFPSTEIYTTTLLHWIFKPAKLAIMGFFKFLPNLFSIIVIILLFRYSIKGLKFFVAGIEKGTIRVEGFYSDWALPTFNIIKVLLYAFMVIIIFPYLPGSNSPIFKGVSVFVGVLFSLGSSNAIANMVAGLVITYMRPFKIGDFVKIGEVTGEIIEKTTLVTRIRTSKFEDVTMPNATILSSSVINFSANTKLSMSGLVMHTTVTIGYDVAWKKIHKALINAALRTDLIESEPTPFVLQTSLDDFYVSYQLNCYTKYPTKQPAIYSGLHQNIQDCFNEDGIEIMSPHYKALRDGNTTTIPETYIAKEYESPVFTIKNKKD
jgi:small-conductance mechanosensitive channel